MSERKEIREAVDKVKMVDKTAGPGWEDPHIVKKKLKEQEEIDLTGPDISVDRGPPTKTTPPEEAYNPQAGPRSPHLPEDSGIKAFQHVAPEQDRFAHMDVPRLDKARQNRYMEDILKIPPRIGEDVTWKREELRKLHEKEKKMD